MAIAPVRGWGDLLELAYDSPQTVESAAAAVTAGLVSARPSVREESVWFVVNALADKRSVPGELLDAALPRDAADTGEWEQFGRELVARRRKKVRTADRSELLRRDGARYVHRGMADLPELSKSERDTVGQLITLNRGMTTQPSREAAVRTVSLPVQGALAATVAAAGCEGNREQVGTAIVSYWPDGRPRRIQIVEGLPASCTNALTALARLSVAEAGYAVRDSPQIVLLPLHPAFLECTGRLNTADDDTHGRPAVFFPPRKVRDVKPVYPESAQRDRIQGVVAITASVTDRGCVAGARVSRSIPALDLSALWAVTQWVYDPPLVDGQVRPMEMTVTVQFKLQ